jgi:hypothetical protein
VLALLALGPVQAVAASKNPAKKQLRTLVRQTKALPSNAAAGEKQRKLRKVARHARRVARRKPCRAVNDLERYRKVLGTITPKKGRRNRRARNRLAALGPTSLQASRRLLSSRRTRRCGGGVAPNRFKQPKFELLNSDANGLSVQVELPALRFVPATGGGQAWTKLMLPNVQGAGAPGQPGIPTIGNQFGVPDGATVSVQPGATESITLEGVDVFPTQPEPVDQDQPRPDFFSGAFADQPFNLDQGAYGTDGLFPPRPAGGSLLGAYRDINVGAFQVPAAQYNPRARTLRVHTSVVVNVSFVGGPHTFSPELSSPWEQPQRQFVTTLLNRDLLRSPINELIRRCGEEMLVITNPATRPAADTFAAARRAAGFRTNVVETGTASSQIGTTAAEIQSYIRARLTALTCIHPSYVTIFGDDDLVPTHAGINGIPSDLPYSMKDNADELPDVAVGRIIGNDQAAVQTAVDKIIGYETTPPSGPMLTRATLAAQFQDDNLDGQENRTFIQFAETVRTGLRARGVTVDRIYDDSPTATPQKFNDGTDLPDELKKPTFAWDGDGADVSAAWNEGRFLMVHRDHGWSDGWGHPGYSTTNVQALTNGSQLPVMMSINCSSAAYDYDETSFVGEALVKPNGGVVGSFGDTRDSPTWHNTQIGLGFVDGLLPSVLPSEGPPDKQTVGNALIHGKLRLAGLSPPTSDGNTRNELYLWHYFGDPSMQMWGGGSPFVLDPSRFTAVFTKLAVDPGDPDPPPPYGVVVTLPVELNGQAVSLLRNGQVIGKAIAADGRVVIPAAFGDGENLGELRVAVEPVGGPPVNVPVEGETSLTQSCPEGDVPNNDQMTISGTLSPGFAGADVVLTYTRPDGTSVERTVETGADGQWSDTTQPWPDLTDDDPSRGQGTWRVRSRYEGDASHAPSRTSECSFFVRDAA